MCTSSSCGQCGFHFHFFDSPSFNRLIACLVFGFVALVLIATAVGSWKKSHEECIPPAAVLADGQQYTVQCVNTDDGLPN